jgi:hypothetical protein
MLSTTIHHNTKQVLFGFKQYQSNNTNNEKSFYVVISNSIVHSSILYSTNIHTSSSLFCFLFLFFLFLFCLLEVWTWLDNCEDDWEELPLWVDSGNWEFYCEKVILCLFGSDSFLGSWLTIEFLLLLLTLVHVFCVIV